MKIALALGGIIGGLLAVSMMRPSAPLPLADPSDYRVAVADCWEPDIINASSTTLSLAVQARLGNGQTSEVHVTDSLSPGEGAHLHIFADAWDEGRLGELISAAEEHGCDLIVRVANRQPVSS